MNRPIKKVAIFCLVMFAALFLDGNWIQVVKAGSYSAHPDNLRNSIYAYTVDRGNIIVGSTNVASSTLTKNATMKYQRVYSNGPEYAPITGYFSSNYGTSNLEQFENTLLNGTDTSLATQNFLRQAEGKDKAGGSVVTTIDPAAQDAAYNNLISMIQSTAGGQGTGAVVALNPKTGAILALASAPSYDPNQLASPNVTTQNNYANSLVANNNELDQALNQTYPPGSTFKIVTSATAFTDGIDGQSVTPNSDLQQLTNLPVSDLENSLPLPGTTTSLTNSGNEACPGTTFLIGFENSCNTIYGEAGMKVGATNLQNMAEAFGFNKTGPKIPMPAATSNFPLASELNQPQLAQSAIGQYNVTMTPLQGAMLAETVANGGTTMAPYLIAKELDTKGNVMNTASPTVFGNPVSSQVAAELSTMMQGVVTNGTAATSLGDIGVSVAAKTGTAQRGVGQNAVAWMVAYAPVNNPQVAVAVMVADNGVQNNDTFGNSVAGPVAAAVIKAVVGNGGSN